MVTTRSSNEKRFPARNATGKRQCRECGTERPDKAPWHSWCSPGCVTAYKVRAWPAHARELVFDRDKGVCAICRCDTLRLEQWIKSLPTTGRLDLPHGHRDRFVTGYSGAWLGRHRWRAVTLLGRLWRVSLRGRMTYWDADHRVPVAEGGGSCDLDNLRTLCLRCHKHETDALKGRLARRTTKGVGRGF